MSVHAMPAKDSAGDGQRDQQRRKIKRAERAKQRNLSSRQCTVLFGVQQGTKAIIIAYRI